MELLDVVRKLVGPVSACGETSEDARRLANLRELTDLTSELIVLIATVYDNAHPSRASEKAIRDHAGSFLREWHKEPKP